MVADSCHSSQNSSEPTGGMIDEFLGIRTYVQNYQWCLQTVQEGYINKCGVTSYH